MAAGASMNVPDDDLDQDGVAATHPLDQAPSGSPLSVTTQGLDSSDASTQASTLPPPQPNAIDQQPQSDTPQKSQIPTPPPAKFDQKKLAKANTTLDLLNAMRPQSRSDYMDWWEKQHGDINDRYDRMQQQLGQRPTDTGLSRKEKFAALLEFGLHLLKASSQPTYNQGAALTGTLSDTVDDTLKQHQDSVAQAQKDYDTQSSAIEDSRAAALKQLGTPSQAEQAQSATERDEAAATASNARAYRDIEEATAPPKPDKPQPTEYFTASDGSLQALIPGANGQVSAKPVLGIDGKPIKGTFLGRSGGGSTRGGADTAQMRNERYLEQVLGVDRDNATEIAFHVKTGDPANDHRMVYRELLQATAGDTEAAQRGADQYVMDNYGADGLSRMRQTSIVPRPASQYDLKGLKPGFVRKFPDGTRWTLGIDGKPTRLPGDFGAQH